jgi:hypothetical protein
MVKKVTSTYGIGGWLSHSPSEINTNSTCISLLDSNLCLLVSQRLAYVLAEPFYHVSSRHLENVNGLVWGALILGYSAHSKDNYVSVKSWTVFLKADLHIPCRSPAMPFCIGFRLCLSHLIYTVRPCLIHTYHAVPMPCHATNMHFMAGSWQGRGRVTSCEQRGNGMVLCESNNSIGRLDAACWPPASVRLRAATMWN